MLAMVCFGVARLFSAGQRHAYDAGATPLPSYHLTSGRTYQMSAPGGVIKLKKLRVIGQGMNPSCFWSTDGGPQKLVEIVSTSEDERDLHAFAVFRAPRTGNLHISCAGIDRVFVDDADNAAGDTGAALMLAAILLGVAGLAAALSGGYSLTLARLDPDEAAI
jgi:hypothetical protein